MNKFIYRLQWGLLYTLCRNGIELDSYIGSALARGALIEELKITIEAVD